MPLGIEQFGRAFAHRVRRGLYGGRQVLFGNKISEDGGNKSRRKWLPNAQWKKLFSDKLDKLIRVQVTPGTMRNMDKAGGFDRYLFKIKGTKEDTPRAQQIRDMLLIPKNKLRRMDTTFPKYAADFYKKPEKPRVEKDSDRPGKANQKASPKSMRIARRLKKERQKAARRQKPLTKRDREKRMVKVTRDWTTEDRKSAEVRRKEFNKALEVQI